MLNLSMDDEIQFNKLTIQNEEDYGVYISCKGRIYKSLGSDTYIVEYRSNGLRGFCLVDDTNFIKKYT